MVINQRKSLKNVEGRCLRRFKYLLVVVLCPLHAFEIKLQQSKSNLEKNLALNMII